MLRRQQHRTWHQAIAAGDVQLGDSAGDLFANSEHEADCE
jgi:hypothetical protein